jgi:hypothetical protein
VEIKENKMKYILIFVILLTSACNNFELWAHLEAERDFAYHQYHMQHSEPNCYNHNLVDHSCYYEEIFCDLIIDR